MQFQKWPALTGGYVSKTSAILVATTAKSALTAPRFTDSAATVSIVRMPKTRRLFPAGQTSPAHATMPPEAVVSIRLATFNANNLFQRPKVFQLEGLSAEAAKVLDDLVRLLQFLEC